MKMAIVVKDYLSEKINKETIVVINLIKINNIHYLDNYKE